MITSMEKMMQELSLKNAEIEELKQAQAAPKENTADISSYLEKIRDLEGKLAEYEIIEDDIADLSLFKEENMQLKRRLEALGENVSAANPSSLSSSSDQSSKVATSPPEMAHEGVSESSEKSALAESEPPDNTDNINDMLKEATAELTADLDILNQSLHETSTNEGAVASSEKSGVSTGGESARAAQKPAESQEEDILAEFTRSLGHLSQPPSKEREAPEKSALFAEEPKLAEESVSKGEVDTNRMLEEIEGLETLLGEENQDSSLEESVDTDKMAMEASSLVVNE